MPVSRTRQDHLVVEEKGQELKADGNPSDSHDADPTFRFKK
jgi:hypothetical protein